MADESVLDDIEPVEIMCLQMEAYAIEYADMDPKLEELLVYGAKTIRFLTDQVEGMDQVATRSLEINDELLRGR